MKIKGQKMRVICIEIVCFKLKYKLLCKFRNGNVPKNVENRSSYQHYLIRSFKINAETTATLQRNLDTSERPALRKRLCENFKKIPLTKLDWIVIVAWKFNFSTGNWTPVPFIPGECNTIRPPRHCYIYPRPLPGERYPHILNTLLDERSH